MAIKNTNTTSGRPVAKNNPLRPMGGKPPVFAAHPVPTKEQVKRFERAVRREARQEEIEDNLSEIYRDEAGNMVDVSRFKPRQKSVFVSVIKNLFVLAVLFCLGYGLFYYFFSPSSNEAKVDLKVSAPASVKAGETFTYTINYENRSEFPLSNIRLELKYPENFERGEVSGEALPIGNAGNFFEVPDLSVGARAEIKIIGKLLAKEGSANVMTVGLSYEPQDFSSEFKTEAVSSVLVSGLGFDVGFEYSNAVLVGQENEVDIAFNPLTETFLDEFDLSFAFPENISLVASTSVPVKATSSPVKIEKNNLSWHLSNMASSSESYHLPVRYQVNRKVGDTQDIILRLSRTGADGKTYVFLEKVITLNIMTSNLNLTLSVNDNKAEGAANFGDELNYSLSYTNKSENILQDIVLMVVLESDWLDWSSLQEAKGGKTKNNTIVWTKEELPDLASLAPGSSGTLDFQIKLKPYDHDVLGKNAAVQSYAYFNLGGKSTGLNDSKSNTVLTKINSDFQFKEKVLYFNEDNMPVGSGPLPPAVGQETSVRVYWNIENNLHELKGVKVSTQLPDYVNFKEVRSSSQGNLSFDPVTRSVVWDLGDLPISVYQAGTQFDVSLLPSAAQRNSLLVILRGAGAQALDADTGAILTAASSPKTTKLEDDDIAGLSNSGLIQ